MFYLIRQVKNQINQAQGLPPPPTKQQRRQARANRRAGRDGYPVDQYQDLHAQQAYAAQPGYPSQQEQGYAYPPTQNSESNEPTKSTWEVWWPRIRIILAIFLPVLLETLDYTIVATSQTNIASQFNRLDLQSYIGTAYVLGSTVFLPIFASLADIFGRLWAMQGSVFIFMIGSAISTGANSMPLLLVGRGIAGVGAAGLLSVVRIILSDSANLDDNNVQSALMVLMYAIGYTVGPILGGALLKVNWRWIFGINLPICAVSIIIMYIMLRNWIKGPQPPSRFKHLPPDVAADLQEQVGTGFSSKISRIDFVGALLFIALGVLLLLGLNWGSTESWSSVKVIICLVVGAVLLLVFIVWEYVVDHSTDHLARQSNALKDPEAYYASGGGQHIGTRARAARFSPKFTRITDPMLPMNMFRSYDICATDFATFTSGMVMLGIFYFVATFYVVVNGNDATHAGVQLLYFAPGIGIGAVIATRLVKATRQPKWSCIIGSILTPIGIGILSQALYNEPNKIKASLLVTGAGVGFSFAPLSYQARYCQPEDRIAIVVASNLFFRSAGGTVGLAQLSAVMYSKVRSYITNAVKSGRISIAQAGQITSSLSSIDATNGNGGINGLPSALKDVVNDAFRDGLRWAFLSLIPWMVISFVLCLFLSRIDENRHMKEREEKEALEKKGQEAVAVKEVSHSQ